MTLLHAEPRTCQSWWAVGGYTRAVMENLHWSHRQSSKTFEEAVENAKAIARETGQDIGVFFMDDRFQHLVVKRSQWYDHTNRPKTLRAVVTWEGEVLQ